MNQSGVSYSSFNATYANPRPTMPLAAYSYSPGVYHPTGLRSSFADWDSDPYLYEASRNDLISPFKDPIVSSTPPFSLSFSSSQFSNSCSSPATPLQALFSSPSALWAAVGSSVSPVHRCGVRSLSRSATHNKPGTPRKGRVSPEKIQSLLAYKDAQELITSFEPGCSSGSSSKLLSPALSALSSMPTSPCTPTRSVRGSPAAQAVAEKLSPPAASTSAAPKSKIMDSADKRAMREALGLRYNTRARRLAYPSESLPAAFSAPTRPPGSRKRLSRDTEREQSLALPARKKRRSNPEERTSKELTGPAADPATDEADEPALVPQRTFPPSIPLHPEFPLFYRRFAVSSYQVEHVSKYAKTKGLSDATFNPPRDAFDLYTPRFVKGRGTTKVGLCPCCMESKSRGGEGKRLWLSTKFSAFNYHMQYAHGISVMSGRPFSPPLAFRTVQRTTVGKLEKAQLMQGKCHKCKKWVAVEGVKDVPTKVKEIYWWKHAAACHQGSTVEGETDIYIEDDIYRAAVQAEKEAAAEAEAESDADAEGEAESDADAEGELEEESAAFDSEVD
ncbi:uncharacterized protein C8Q71DRAFT_740957 [Rhodofomes roseus]|uniref:Transcription regulator Rua1 C-terminal domain-containing protein n=1 Tax=Rhodofomes roseus TaxID=34475 RepID=A0ABQ8KQD0_9APHY|nr:uncharacterized protein C8Q71DRAFT_740957 [Rhodofomes roseus]KAH9840735.1 hypothetical protein C8Q71DRAFT_740957 [Rhodofomes roseus]